MKKNIYNYLILASFVLIAFFIITRDNRLFGSLTDWLNQHSVFPDYLRNMFYKTGKIIPNFLPNLGGGQNIYSISYYGLLNPIILISYLLPFIEMKDYIVVSNLLLVITSSILLFKLLINNKIDSKVSLITTIIYLCSAPLIFHSHRHIMFVNYFPFLISSLIGVDKLLENNNRFLLIISIFLMILSSYYYSVCGLIVIGIYYIFKYFKNNDNKIRIFFVDLFKFILTCFIPILMAGILLIPTAFTIFGGREGSVSINLFSLLLPSRSVIDYFFDTYSIGIGLIGILALFYLLFTKKKYNIITFVLVMFVFGCKIFKFLLNGGLYLVNKCFIPFLPLIACFVGFFINDLITKKIDFKKIFIFIFGCSLIFIFAKFKMLYIYYFIAYLVIFLIYYKFKNKNLFLILLLIPSIVMLYISNSQDKYISKDFFNYINNDNVKNSIKDVLDKDKDIYRIGELEEPYYRVNKVYDDRHLSYSFFSSTYNKNLIDFVRHDSSSNNDDPTPFFLKNKNDLMLNSLMGVKYIYSDIDLGLGFEKVGDKLFKNKFALPIIYGSYNLLNVDEFNNYAYPYKKEILLHNTIIDEESSNSDIRNNINKYDLKYSVVKNDGVIINKNDKGYKLVIDDNGYLEIKLDKILKNKLLFIEVEGLKANFDYKISMTINDVENILKAKTDNYYNSNETFRFLIDDEIIDKLYVKFTPGIYNIDNINFYVMDFSNYTIMNNIEKFEFNNYSQEISGNINMKNEGYLVTSIPYDDGFSVYIDDVLVNKEKVNKAFLGSKIGCGEHKVVIKYNSLGMKYGYFCTILGFIIFNIILFFDSKKKKV